MSKKTVKSLYYLVPRARLAFTKLRQVFIKALILYYFNPKYHIQIETDIVDHTIGEIFSKLTLDDLS